VDREQLKGMALDAAAASKSAGNTFLHHLTGTDWVIFAIYTVFVLVVGHIFWK
jgi:hypothetical protein